MSLFFEISIIVIGALLAGLNGLIVYILSDLKGWLKTLNDDFKVHVTDKTLHTECGKVHK
ncbi:MAG: hypothetical protein WCH86_02360 [Kiritimatiellales bacterium]